MPGQLLSFGVATFVVAVCAAFTVAMEKWGSVVYISLQDVRSPAAVRRTLDVSGLTGQAFLAATHERLLASARIVKDQNRFGIEFGNFVTKNSQGQKVLACQAYRHIRIELRAEGVAESGSVPEMIIEGECRWGKDLSRIEPIWVPVQEILHQKPGALTWAQTEASPSTITFKHVGSQWPKLWQISTVRLYDKGEQDQPDQNEIFIGPEKILKIHEKPISMQW